MTLNFYKLKNKNIFFFLHLLIAMLFFLGGCVDQGENAWRIRNQLSEMLQNDTVGNSPSVNLISPQNGLLDALEQAVATNPAYIAALAVEREASANIDIASSSQRPLLSLNANLGAVQGRGASTNIETGLTTNLSVSQLIYDGGASAAVISQAFGQALVAQVERRLLVNEIAFRASLAWIDVWQFGQRIDLLRSRKTEIDAILVQIGRMVDAGILDSASYDGAQRRIAEFELEEARLQTDLQEAQISFRRYFGLSVERVRRPDELASIQQALPLEQLWQEALLLQKAGLESLIARSAVNGAEAGFRPRANIVGGISSPIEHGEPVSSSLGVALEYTLGDGGRRQATLINAEQRLLAAEARFAEAQASVKAELDSAVARLDAIERSMVLIENSVRLSAAELDAVKSQIATGQSSLLQVEEAEIASYRAQDRRIALQAERLTLYLTVASIVGALDEFLDLEE